MKKSILMLAMALGISGAAMAQSTSTNIFTNGKIKWGVRAGIEVPALTVKWDDGSNFKFNHGNIGFELGPTAYYDLKDEFYLNVSLLYNMKKHGHLETDNNQTKKLTYLTMPIYLGYRIPIGNTETYAQAGPYVGYKLSEKQTENGKSTPYQGLKKADVGFALMYGVNIKQFKVQAGSKIGLINTYVPGAKARLYAPLSLGVVYGF
jgi:opacity protein-like surface antigen